MKAKDGDGVGGLLPGLPDDLVLNHVITRLPWFIRPVCRAVSKAWLASIDDSTKRPELLVKSREHFLPLLQDHFLVSTFDAHIFIANGRHNCSEEQRLGYHCVQWREETYQICRKWRELSSLPEISSDMPVNLKLMATGGMVYAWRWTDRKKLVWKIDLAGGDWIWKELAVPYPFNRLAVPFNGKIYLPNVSTKAKSAADEEEKMVLVHDMTTEQSELVKTWNRDNLRVVRNRTSEASSGTCEEELFSFVEHEMLEEAKLEILVYDDCKDSWRTKEMIPFSEFRWSEIADIKLVNGDCFEPAPDGGINTVWVDNEGQVLTWFNSFAQETWVDFDYNTNLEGKCLEYLQFRHGGLYGMFIEEKDDEDDIDDETKEGWAGDRRHQQDPTLSKRTIMKGKMVVQENKVHWEEVLDIGCFRDSYYLSPAVFSPVDDYTVMA